MIHIFNYKNLTNLLSETFQKDTTYATATTPEKEQRKHNSLMYLSYQRKVSDGLLPASDNNCDSCVCFGDEWPL